MITRNVIGRFAALFLSLVLVRAPAADFYVSTQGSDLNPGTLAQPFQTITHAYGLAAPGSTINVMPGVYSDYTGGWGLRLRASGAALLPIVLKSQVPGGAVIDGQNASNRNVAIYLDGSYNIVDGFEINGGPGGGIKVWGNFNQIINCEIHHNGNPASMNSNGQDGIYSNPGTHHNIYRANYIHDNGRTGSNLDHGLYLCGDNELVINNVLVRNAATGLQIAGYSTVSGMKVYNNVMAFNGTSGIILWQALSGVDIKNNIIYRNGRNGIGSWDAHGSAVVIDRNLLFGNGSGEYNLANGGSDFTYTRGTAVFAEPLFVDSTSASFDPHLRAGSLAINAGLDLSSVFATDKDGAARPASGAWDLGAYRDTNATSPEVVLTAPGNNTTVSGSSVTIAANVSSNADVQGVQFKLNGTNLGAEDTTTPYGMTFNTTTIANGPHLLSAVSRDAAGDLTTAIPVVVIVNNNTPPTISRIANQTISAGTSAGIAFTVSDAQTPASGLTLSASSSNPTLISRGDIVFGGSGASRTVTAVPATNQFGTATITVTVSDGIASTSTNFLLKVKPAINPQFVYLPFEAESGRLMAPMLVTPDAGAGEGQFIQSSSHNLGTAEFDVNIPVPGAYSIWGRILSADNGHDSFYVSVDGAADDIYDTAENSRTNAWQWALVNGRGGTNSTTPLTINPRTFLLSAGQHTVTFRGRELGTGLDQILLTNDPDYVPRGTVLTTAQPVTISSIAIGPAGIVTLTWPTAPGRTYRVAYRTNLSDTGWISLGSDQTASATITSRSDSVIGKRYYSVITLP